MIDRSSRDSLLVVADELADLRAAMVDAVASHGAAIDAVHPDHRQSAVNLLHYVELRRHDVRDLQDRLAQVGLSSLGRAEAHVLATVEDVLAFIAVATGTPAPERLAAIDPRRGRELLDRNARLLLGPAPARRRSRILVTLPSEAGTADDLVIEMRQAGMDLARINCAHDDAEAWIRMATAVRAPASDESRALVAMDIAGPKLRTGPVRSGPQVVRVAPRRDPDGTVSAAARVWLHHGHIDTPPGCIGIPVDDDGWIRRRRVGDRLELVDRRGAPRRWEVVEVAVGGVLAVASQTAYVATGTTLECPSLGGADRAAVAELPTVELTLRVAVGDTLELTRSLEPAEPTNPGDRHRIGCTAPEVFDHVRPGHRVFLDDGKIAGVVTAVSPEVLAVRVTSARNSGTKLKADKGINLPDSSLDIGALTAKDRRDLDVVAHHADLVNVSFVRRPTDVAEVHEELESRGASDIGLVLKIENADAFHHLPQLLLSAMRRRRVGVMIARGDLAVEVGFERLAEVQEEILWICEAAHVPVIWATEVLDTMARTGRPSRAEVTDAAMAVRAECVMLNKGPHVVDAIRALDSILLRMQRHQDKKRTLLRRLGAWDGTDSPLER